MMLNPHISNKKTFEFILKRKQVPCVIRKSNPKGISPWLREILEMITLYVYKGGQENDNQ